MSKVIEAKGEAFPLIQVVFVAQSQLPQEQKLAQFQVYLQGKAAAVEKAVAHQ